jgi:hypothetical protein
VYFAPGSGSFTVPTGVRSLVVELCGGGAGGGTTSGGAGGGGGGAYLSVNIAVTSADPAYGIQVAGPTNSGISAGPTSFSAGIGGSGLILVAGGGITATSTTGGAGGTPSITDPGNKIFTPNGSMTGSGQKGADAVVVAVGTVIGGQGGASVYGGGGVPSGTAAGGTGGPFGAGGKGLSLGVTAPVATQGAAGFVKISYINP